MGVPSLGSLQVTISILRFQALSTLTLEAHAIDDGAAKHARGKDKQHKFPAKRATGLTAYRGWGTDIFLVHSSRVNKTRNKEFV